MPHPWERYAAPVLVAAFAAALGVFQSQFPVSVPPAWLWAGPVGVSLTAGLLWGWRGAAGAVFGTAFAAYQTGAEPAAIAALVLGSAAEAGFAAWSCRRGLPLAPGFDHPADVGRFAMLATNGACLRGIVAAAAASVLTAADPASAAVGVTAADWLGNLILAPGLLVFLRTREKPERVAEAAVVLTVATAGVAYFFAGPEPYSLEIPLPLVAGLVVLGYHVAVRFSVRGMALVVWAAAAVVCGGAAVRGTFAPLIPTDAGVLRTTGLLLGFGFVILVQYLFAATARRGLLRDRERDGLLAAAGAQAARFRDLNERLSLSTLEIADQASELERQRDVFEALVRELAEKQTWLEAVLSQMPLGTILVDRDLRVTARNRRFDELHGLAAAASLPDLGAFEPWPCQKPDGTPLQYDQWPLVRAMRDGGEVHEQELRIGRYGGGWFDATVSAAPVRSPSGEILGGVLLTSDLTAVRAAERSARENEDRLRFALHAGRLIAWEWDLDSRSVKRSEPLEVRLGLAADVKYTVSGTLTDRLHPDDRAAMIENQRQILSGELGFSAVEYRLRHESGDYVSFESRGRILRDDAGNPTRVMAGILIDVSDRRGAEERLRLLESAVVHAHDAVIVLEAYPAPGRGRAVLYVNAAFTRITGYDPDEVVGRSLHFLGGPDTDPATLDRLRVVLETGTRFGGEVLNYRKDNSPVWVDVSLVPVVGPGGTTTHFVMIQRDISARKATEAALTRSENLFRGIFESTAAGVSLTDARGVFVRCNPSFAAMLGRPVDGVLGRSAGELTHPNDWEQQAVLVGGLIDGTLDQYQVRKRYVRPDGTELWAELSVSAIRNDAGALQFGLGVAVDVTARMKLEDQLRQAQKMEALGQLAGGVAHDFNNLLTAVVGNLGLVRLRPGDPNAPLLRTVEQAAARAADLTRKLLGYARRNQLLVAPVRPGELFAEVFDILRRTLDPRIAIRTESAADCTVQADATLLIQALLNLCLNARDAMPDGGELILAAAETDVGSDDPHPDAKPGRYVRLSVTDTGHGMDETVRGRLFEPFFTTKGVGRGTGLGLPMVHGILRQHGGWVTVESRVGRGSRFELFLPASRAAAAAAPPRLDPRLPEPDPDLPPLSGTVLLVDDEAMIRQLGRTVLENGGLTVVEAEDGREAVDTYLAAPGGFDLVILDVTMPRLSGRDAYREILAHDPGARVLFSSGYSAEDLSELEAAKGLLSKPYRPADLLAAVRTALADAPELAAV